MREPANKNQDAQPETADPVPSAPQPMPSTAAMVADILERVKNIEAALKH